MILKKIIKNRKRLKYKIKTHLEIKTNKVKRKDLIKLLLSRNCNDLNTGVSSTSPSEPEMV